MHPRTDDDTDREALRIEDAIDAANDDTLPRPWADSDWCGPTREEVLRDPLTAFGAY